MTRDDYWLVPEGTKLHRLSPEALADEVKDYPEPLRARVEAIGIGDGGRYARIRLRTKEDT